MGIGLFLIFIAVPLVELALLIQLGGWIGVWPTLAIILITAIAGTALLRQQGLQTLHKVMTEFESGKPPVVPMVEGVLLAISGAFLLTPGLITDITGALMLVPPLRTAAARTLINAAMRHGVVRVVRTRSWSGTNPRADGQSADFEAEDVGPGRQPGPGERNRHRPHRNRPHSDQVIDGDFERLDEKTIDPNRGRRR